MCIYLLVQKRHKKERKNTIGDYWKSPIWALMTQSEFIADSQCSSKGTLSIILWKWLKWLISVKIGSWLHKIRLCKWLFESRFGWQNNNTISLVPWHFLKMVFVSKCFGFFILHFQGLAQFKLAIFSSVLSFRIHFKTLSYTSNHKSNTSLLSVIW